MLPAFFAAYAAIYAPWALTPEDFFASNADGEAKGYLPGRTPLNRMVIKDIRTAIPQQ
jgi:hypothetical protein